MLFGYFDYSFNLTDKSIRTLATCIRKAVGESHMSLAKSLEIASQGLGFRNWDTLSGMLKKPDADSVELQGIKLPVTLYVGAFAVDDYATGPQWARLEITEAFLRSLLDKRRVCSEHRLEIAVVNGGPDEWHEPNAEQGEFLNIRGDSLYVCDSFWFRANPKHCDYAVETRGIYIDRLLDVLRSRANDDTAFWVDVGTLVMDGSRALELAQSLGDAGALTEEQLDNVDKTSEQRTGNSLN